TGRNRGHGATHVLIGVANIRDIVVDHRRVVGDVIVVGHVGDVGDVGIGYIHLLEIRAADGIGGHVRLTPAQRKPAHASAATEREAYAEVGAADPGNEGRRINRTCDYYRARRPSPVSAGVDPAAAARG